MILAVDVGNTNIVFGGFDNNGELRFISRLNTQVSRMEDQYAIKLKDILSLYGFENAAITGLNIKIDDPSVLGSDLVCGGVAAKSKYPTPCIFIDVGTCLKIFALDRSGAMLGGAIAPGPRLSFEALSGKTASLPLIGAEPVGKMIGTNSPDSMRAGVIGGIACMIDGMIERYEEELGEKATIVATGGYASLIAPLCRRELIVDPDLVLEGLHIIYKKNQKK